MMKNLLILTIALTVIGCGRMNVRVAILDRRNFDAYLQVKDNLPALIEQAGELDEQAHRAEAGKDEAAAKEAREKLKRVDRAILRSRAYIAMVETNQPFAGLFGGVSGLSATTVADETKQAMAEAGARPPGAVNVNSMREASAVVYAPDRFWRRSVNGTKAFGAYGNVDIAVRMTPDPDYSIKAFRVDSAKLIANTVVLTRQMVAVVAASYGIPTSVTGSGGTESSWDYATELEQLAGRTQAAVQRRRALAAAQESLLQAISAEADNLADDAKAPDAVKRIQSVYLAQKKVLETPSAQ